MELYTPSLLWVAWNIFLALIPVALGLVISVMVGKPDRPTHWAVKVPIAAAAAAWLVFLPNTAYLLTQWRHFLQVIDYSNLCTRWQVDGVAAYELMTYTLFYLCYSGVGVLTFALAVRPVAAIANRKGLSPVILGIPFFVLISVGVYLGLVLRFNSWDLVYRPDAVWDAAVGLTTRPLLGTFVVGFGGFLWLVYLAADIWIEGLIVRWRQWFTR